MTEFRQKHYDNFHKQLVGNTNAVNFLKMLQPNLGPKNYEFLYKKVSQAKHKAYKAKKVGPNKYILTSGNTTVSFTLPKGKSTFSINNRSYKYDPSKKPTVIWDEILLLFPKETATAPLLNLLNPQAHAFTPLLYFGGAALVSIIGAGYYYFNEPYYTEEIDCLYYDLYIDWCGSWTRSLKGFDDIEMHERCKDDDSMETLLKVITISTDLQYSRAAKRLDCEYADIDKEAKSKTLRECIEPLVDILPLPKFERLSERVKKRYDVPKNPRQCEILRSRIAPDTVPMTR